MNSFLRWLFPLLVWTSSGLVLTSPLPAAAQGGFITEFGGGFMLPQASSYLMTPECYKATVIVPMDNPRSYGGLYSCGGDDPMFVGWPVAWEFPNKVKLGIFHYSHWFDNDGESQFTCICASGTIHWRRFRH